MNHSGRRPSHRVFVLAFGACVLATSVPAKAGDGGGPPVFDVMADKDFSRFREPLAAYLRSRGARRQTTVCILGEQQADGTKSAWVIWLAGNTILLWDGGRSAMTTSRRVLDLKRDVVATDDAVQGSTYLVTRGWVDSLTRRCRHVGARISVTAKALAQKAPPIAE